MPTTSRVSAGLMFSKVSPGRGFDPLAIDEVLIDLWVMLQSLDWSASSAVAMDAQRLQGGNRANTACHIAGLQRAGKCALSQSEAGAKGGRAPTCASNPGQGVRDTQIAGVPQKRYGFPKLFTLFAEVV